MLDLNELPMPAYHKIDIRNYSLALGSAQRSPGIGIVVSRGCPSLCTYCHGPLFGKKVRFRSTDRILKEIELLRSTYHIKEIAFYDDNFTIFKDGVRELCHRMIEQRMNLSWSCFSKVTFVNDDLLALMKRAGCHQILYGIESGSPEILKTIKKRISLQQAEEAVRLTKKHRINVRAAFMLGNPGETEDALQQTLDFAIKLNPDRAIFNITTPFPGTEMFEWAQEHGYLLTTNWEEYDLSKPVMQLPTVSNDVIAQYYQQSYRRFYLRWGYIIRQVFLWRNWRSLLHNAWAAIRVLWYVLTRS
jgi:radical SAM superfamily enzyme YgiQ (UPF0313 family)